MSRGFLVGLLWGVVVSAAGLVVVSLVAPPLPTEIAAADSGAVSAASSEPAAAAVPDDVAETPPDPAPEKVTEPVAAASEPAVGTVTLNTGSAEPAPSDATTEGNATAPVADPAAPAPDSTEAPVAPAKGSPEPAPSVETNAAAQVASAEGVEDAGSTPSDDAAPVLPKDEPSAVTAPAADAAPAPDPGTMPAPKQDKLLDPPALSETPAAETAPAVPETEVSGGSDLPQVPAQPATPDAPEAAAEPEVAPELAPEAGSTLVPDASLDKDAAGVVSNRLPRIGDSAEGAQDAGTAALTLDPADALPITAHAREFVAEEGKPRFAILLMDIGAQGMARDDLVKLPFAVTFVIDPTAPDAALAATAYRAAGQEVMILAKGLPEGATAADLEQSFQALAAELPQTVAMLDAATGGLQENRLLATQAIPILKSQGRGIVTYDRGLGAAEQVAAREGLAHAAIFRDLDAEGEDTPLIRRYLDRAAFKAAQEGAVTVIGQTRPETVAAILEWLVEGRGASVQLAPVTAVMVAE